MITSSYLRSAMSRLLATLLMVPVVTLAAPALKDRPPKEPPSIVGEWVRVSHTQAGKSERDTPDHHDQVFKADGAWEYSYGGRPSGLAGMTYVTDPKQAPPAIAIGGGGQRWRGIYKVEADTLTLCLFPGDGTGRRSESSTDADDR